MAKNKVDESSISEDELSLLAQSEKSGVEIGKEYYSSLTGTKVASTPKLVLQRFMDGARNHIVKAHMEQLASGEKALQEVGQSLSGDPLFDFIENKTEKQRETSSRFISSNLPKLVEESLIKKYTSDAKRGMDDMMVAQKEIRDVIVRNLGDFGEVYDDMDINLFYDTDPSEIGDKESSILVDKFIKSSRSYISELFQHDPDEVIKELEDIEKSLESQESDMYKNIRGGKIGSTVNSISNMLTNIKHPKEQEFKKEIFAKGATKSDTISMRYKGYKKLLKEVEIQLETSNARITEETEAIGEQIVEIDTLVEQSKKELEKANETTRKEMTDLKNSYSQVFEYESFTPDMVEKISLKQSDLGVKEGKEDTDIVKAIADFFTTGEKTSKMSGKISGD